jgi:hypothetical protein
MDPIPPGLAEQIAAALLELLVPSLASGILTALGLQPNATAAQEHVAYAIESTVIDNQVDIRSDTHGLAKLASDLSTMAGDITTLSNNLSNLTTAVANLSTAPSAGSIAQQVWEYHLGDGELTFNMLSWLERLGDNIETYAALGLRGNPLFTIEGKWKHPSD